MNSENEQAPDGGDSHDAEAADWLVGQDRGLFPEERAALERRRAEDPAFEKALEETASTWERIGKLPEDMGSELLRKSHEALDREQGKVRQQFFVLGLAAVLVLSLGLYSVFQWGILSGDDSALREIHQTPTTQVLPDGTLARLNVGAHIEFQYSAETRIVELKRGEAHFKVVENTARPFIVKVNGVQVVAVGTSFGVQSRENRVDVIVTEGLVQIIGGEDRDREEPALSDPIPPVQKGYVSSGQRALVRMQKQKNGMGYNINILGSPPEEVEKILSWRQPLLTLEGDSLGNIADNFKTKTGRELLIANPELANLKIGGRFSSDEPERFLEILRLNYGIEWHERGDGTLVIGSDQ